MSESSLIPRILRIALIAALITALSFCLIACGLVQEKKKITSVTLEPLEGLTLAEGEQFYYADAGEEFTIRAVLNSDAPSSVSVEWSVAENGGEPRVISGEKERTLKYTLPGGGSEFGFTAKVSGVSCDAPIRVRAVYPGLRRATITSPSHSIVDNTIRQNAAAATDVSLVGGWNADGVGPSTVVTGEWYVGGVKAADGLSFVYPAPSAEGEVEVRFTARGDGKEVSATVTLSFVASFVAVDDVGLSVSGAEAVGGQYLRLSSGNSYAEVTVEANAEPFEGTDLSSEVVWKIRDKDGVRIAEHTGRSLTFTPKHGENYVTATIDNIESEHAVIIALPSAEYEARKAVISDTYVWQGGIYNFYILDQTDLNVAVMYLVAEHRYGGDYARDMYLYKQEWKQGIATTQAFNSDDPSSPGALNIAMSYVDESGTLSIYASADAIWMGSQTDIGEPAGKAPSQYSVFQYENVLLHYDGVESARELPIDRAKRSLTVRNSNQLFRAVQWGYRPVFEDNPAGAALSELYAKARRVARTIVEDGMSELEKARAVYEWIVMEVGYDYAAAESDADNAMDYNAYYLEGVFNDGIAVCDGKSKAFSLLCGIEGIRSARITGTVNDGGSSYGHAWNKVLLDADGDSVREWYTVDTTWGDVPFSSGYNRYEMLSMEYFLVSDAYLAETRVSGSAYDPEASSDFDYYRNTFVSAAGREVPLYVENDADLKALVGYCLDRGGMRLNVKVAPAYAGPFALETKVQQAVTELTGSLIVPNVDVVELNSAEGIYVLKILKN